MASSSSSSDEKTRCRDGARTAADDGARVLQDAGDVKPMELAFGALRVADSPSA